MEYYVGLDVSLKQTSICVVDQSGSVVREGVVDSDPEAISVYVRSKAPGADDAAAYLRVAHMYMLISMPTGTSTIFGAFQAIWLSFDTDELLGGSTCSLVEFLAGNQFVRREALATLSGSRNDGPSVDDHGPHLPCHHRLSDTAGARRGRPVRHQDRRPHDPRPNDRCRTI